ncbi:VPLPA-CTERM sorting domain-containing protein [Rhodovulum sp. YEN HP10]|uniref:VPLPA-CTERM sorting domain-containing protein n=1 Tax=Rhodovulum sp. HP10 TaxID=3387397 RepID=UPI0039DFD85B
MMTFGKLASTTVLATVLATSASAATLTADTELDFFDSGTGPLLGPYGGDTAGGGYPVLLSDTSNALDGDLSTFVSLPTGTFITVGFSSGYVFDGTGDDIFVSEVDRNSDEDANVYVSSDGIGFTFLGTVGTGGTETLDLASIGFADPVTAIRIEGLGTGGGSPGYDLAMVQGLEGSVVITPPSAVPLPAGVWLLLSGLGAMGLAQRKRTGSRQAAPAERNGRRHRPG